MEQDNVRSIMVRAKLTDKEWERFRILALQRNEPTSELVGAAIREILAQQAPARGKRR